ncbi:MAG: inorganic phosphate transporter [Candidatus Cloacimonetes bacterium]|nr:inorganic phosphate transporter [Candidatus Cloacimonadota bacterium]
MILVFLSSGLFLGWSLGANDTANIFGTAVGTKMIKFKMAAIIATIFVILGAVIEGSGASHTLGKLGSINALAGAFIVSLAAALTVTAMTKLKLPVSTSQAIVGGIIGWNFFTGFETNYHSLTKIVTTWVLCPVLAAIFALILYNVFKFFLGKVKIHLLEMDSYTRMGLILAGAFGAYSLGANNIANVMGVFVSSSPFKDINFGNIFALTGIQQLFLIGAIAIGVGIFSYSHKVIKTVGKSLFRLSPITALIVVISESLVLFLFGSTGLRNLLVAHNLPAIPLVPVSSSQAVVGAILGIAIAKGGRNIHYKVLGKISVGWMITPVITGIIAFFALFFIQNVFDQQVYKSVEYSLSKQVIEKLNDENIATENLTELEIRYFNNYREIKIAINKLGTFKPVETKTIVEYSKVDSLKIPVSLEVLNETLFSEDQFSALRKIQGQTFQHRWQLQENLSEITEEWEFKKDELKNKSYNQKLKEKYDYIYKTLNSTK